jgi:hypothetical protein
LDENSDFIYRDFEILAIYVLATVDLVLERIDRNKPKRARL